MRVVVSGDDGQEMLSLQIAKSIDEPVHVLMPGVAERPIVIAALSEAITLCSPPLRPLDLSALVVDVRTLPRKPSLKLVEPDP